MNEPTQYVAVRLVRLRLQSDGALQRSPMFASTVRAALLADLALCGALASTGDGLELDTRPVGFAPADRLLAAVVAQPDKALEWWIRQGLDSVRAVVDALLDSGVWSRHRSGLSHRFRDNSVGEVRADAARLGAIIDGAVPDRPGTAVLAALLGVIGADALPGGRFPDATTVTACGPAAWLLPDLVGNLLERQRLLGAAANEARIALSVNFLQ